MKYYERAIRDTENRVGLSAIEIKSFSPERFRSLLEKKFGRKMSFVSEFPAIGRENVLRDDITTKEELDKEIDNILRESVDD